MQIEKESFVLGMTAAFGECIAQEAKKLAFGPPVKPEMERKLREEVNALCKGQGIYAYLEENRDIPERDRVVWWVLYKFPEALEEYQKLRREGRNPVWETESFYRLLSYGSVWGKGAGKVEPQIRKQARPMNFVAKVLFPDGGWPVPYRKKENSAADEER